MSLISKDTGGMDIDPIPAGSHQAVCYGLVEIGTEPQFGNFPSRKKILILWELPMERADFAQKDGTKKNLPRAISAKYTNSLASKGNLRPMLESWRARKFTEEELKGFDLKTIIGANCMLSILHKAGSGKNAGKNFAEVSAVSAMPKGMNKIKQENPTLLFDLEATLKDNPQEVTFPQNMPEWICKRIEQSDEWLFWKDGKGAQQPEGGQEGTSQNQQPVEEEEVPF